VSRPIDAKPSSCTEGCEVDPTGISGKVSASYAGRSDDLPCATGIERYREGSPEVSRGHSSSALRDEGPNMKHGSRTADLDASR
jgi:hypothetical protein